MRRCAGRYHDGWLVCADGTCAHRTRNIMCSVHRDGDQVDHGLKCPIPGPPNAPRTMPQQALHPALRSPVTSPCDIAR